MNQTTKETAMTTTTARVTAARLAIRAARPRRLTNLLLWAAQIPLAAVFVLFGRGHLTAGGILTVAGTAELAGAIGLLTPWLAGLAAAGLAAVMVGATIINAAGGGGLVFLTAPLCAVFVLLAFARRQQIKALWAAIRR
jgi:uncharacterized membrane protein YphA (DoxX/SURF4 family)